MIYHHQKKTRKHSKLKIKSKSKISHKRTFKNNDTLPDVLLKYYNKHKPQNYNFIWISNQYNSKAPLHCKCDLINKLNYPPHIITMNSLKTNFKTYFPYDYFNFIKYSNYRNASKIPTLTYKKKTIIFEAYLMIISTLDSFKSYILDLVMMKIQGMFEKKQFPLEYDDTFENIFLITNQIFTILKYISIILSNNARLYGGCKIGFEVFKVDLEIDESYGIKLLGCSSKTDWDSNSFENKQLYAWIDNVIFNPRISKKKIVQIGFSTQLLYELKLTIPLQNKTIKYIPPIYAAEMKREDFKNKYILFPQKGPNISRELDPLFLIKSLTKCGLTQSDLYSSMGCKLAFLWCPVIFNNNLFSNLKKQHYNTLFYLANMLDNLNHISEKNALYMKLKARFPSEYLNFLAKSFTLTLNTKYSNSEILIAKPINLLSFLQRNIRYNAFSGTDIIVIDSNEKMEEAKKLLKKYDNVLISNYITNPLLFKTRKFHFRSVFIISLIHDTYNAYFLDTSRILTAKLPFKLEDFSNKDIHDSHVKGTDADYYFPQDFTTENMGITITPEIINTLQMKIRNIMKKIAIIAIDEEKAPIKLFSNHKNGFNIFGSDIMITHDLNPILLECNDDPGFSPRNPEKTFFDEQFFNLIEDVILQPAFLPGNRNHNPNSSTLSLTSLYTKKIK